MSLFNYRPLGIVLCLAMLMAGLWSAYTPIRRSKRSAPRITVSQSHGDDNYDGLAPEWDGVHGPWKTLVRVSDEIKNETAIAELGVKRASLPRKGKKGVARTIHENEKWFKDL